MPVSSFVGREQDMVAVVKLLGRERLVTLTGPAGIGKSRLGLEVATRVAPEYEHGAFLVGLAAVADPSLVPQTVAGALSLPEQPGRDVTATVIAHLRRRHLLLVLDNCEAAIEVCAQLAEVLLRHCPKAAVLTTSQEPLRLAGEHVWRVPPLSVPEKGVAHPEALADVESARLFCDRAAAAHHDFVLDGEAAPAVIEICRRLDGIPLAIELAAGRVGQLGPAEIAARLDDRFHLLTEGSRAAAPRHQSLKAALEWSYDLLTDSERVLLRRLAVFAGGFDLDAAEEICSNEDLDRKQVVGVLGGLVAKSLVSSKMAGNQIRYLLLETVRYFADDKLLAAGEDAAFRLRHLLWYAGHAEQAEAGLEASDQQWWLERLQANHDNVRSALDWTVAQRHVEPGLRLAGAMAPFWRLRGHLSEGRQRLEAVTRSGDDAPSALRAKAALGAGLLAAALGDFTTTIDLAERSLALGGDSGEERATARALSLLGFATMFGPEPATALPLLEKAIAVAREAGDGWCLADSLARSGEALLFQGDAAAARKMFEECLEVATGTGDKQAMARGLTGLGWATVVFGDCATAEDLFRRALGLTDDLGDTVATGETLCFLADMARIRGDEEASSTLLEECEDVAGVTDSPIVLARSLATRGRLAFSKGELAEARGFFEQGAAVGGPAGHHYVVTRCLYGQGMVERAMGHHGEAKARFNEARAVAEGSGDRHGGATALYELATIARFEGDLEQATSLHHQAMFLRHEVGDRAGLADSLEALAGLAAIQGRHRTAGRLFGAAQSIREGTGVVLDRLWSDSLAGSDIARVREDLDTEEFAEVWSRGRSLSVQDAVSYASRGRGVRGRPTTGWASLTNAEREVLRLVQEGMTNAEIGELLFISPRTVGHHLSHMYAKLGLASRRELARAAERHQTDFEGTPAGKATTAK